MRGTKAKAIREFIGNPTDKEYTVKKHKPKEVVDLSGGTKLVSPVQLFLLKSCGRAIYKVIKGNTPSGVPAPKHLV